LNAALKKFDIYPNRLTVPELKALVTSGTTSSDSPVKEKEGRAATTAIP
jgi:hypothetical protein